MKGRFCLLLIYAFLPLSLFSQAINTTSQEVGFEISDLIPQSRVVVNMPAIQHIDPSLPSKIILYALPNGNTIEQTMGRKIDPNSSAKDEWRYDIQNIAAQTRFIREYDKSANYVVVYLESTLKAWTTHSSRFPQSPELYRSLVDTIRRIVVDKSDGRLALEKQEVILSSHSGGGRFLFSYIAAGAEIPSFISRIVFLDSTYGYEERHHSAKIYEWLMRSRKNALVVYSYIDTTVILDGKHIVSPTGGTGYRSREMAMDLIAKGIRMDYSSDTTFCSFKAKGQVQVLIKENPEGRIYHTVLVERNGFVSSIFFGTENEGKDYVFWGPRCYSRQIR